MKCLECGAADMVHDVRDIEYEYKGEKTILRAISGDYCPACGDLVMDMEQSAEYWRQVTDFRRSVNAPDIAPEFIARIRKRLGLDQREAGELFGGGVNAFSRYETGKTTPPVSVVKLFKLFDKKPELFDEYKRA